MKLQGLHLHLDPASGIAGDMIVAALVDAGVPESVVVDSIASVGVKDLSVRFESRRRGAFVGRGFVVDYPGAGGKHEHEHADEHAIEPDHDHQPAHADEHVRGHSHAKGSRARTASSPAPAGEWAHDHHHRDYSEIRRLLKNAKFDLDAKALAEEIFARLAEVEAALHGTTLARVTFHEVGGFDSIADIVGMSAAIAWLAPTAIGSSPPVVGTGNIRTAHGVVAVPAPATAALLRGIPMISEGTGELTTPTGAAFLATVVDAFGPPPPVRLAAIGYGAGTRVIPDRPNVLRALLGEPIGMGLAPAADNALVVETNIDDMSGQLLSTLFDVLFKAGALDVWSAPILMKKGRPAQKVSALVVAASLPAVERAFFLNSTTLGLRRYPVSRSTLARSVRQVETTYGAVAVKIAALDGVSIGATPEYEDCRRRAAAADVPVRVVWAAAVAASAHVFSSLPSLAAAPAARKSGRTSSTRSGARSPTGAPARSNRGTARRRRS